MGTSKTLTPEFRISFPSVFQASAMEGEPAGNAKYSLVMLFPKTTDLSALKKLASEAVAAKWPDPKSRPKTLRSPFRDGDEKDLDGYKGCIYIRASSKSRPGVVDQAVQPILDPEKFYAGAYARATVNAFAYENKGNAGVSFGLMNVQLLRDGEPFGNRSLPSDDFTAVAQAQGTPKSKTAADAVDEWAATAEPNL